MLVRNEKSVRMADRLPRGLVEHPFSKDDEGKGSVGSSFGSVEGSGPRTHLPPGPPVEMSPQCQYRTGNKPTFYLFRFSPDV